MNIYLKIKKNKIWVRTCIYIRKENAIKTALYYFIYE